MLGAFKAAVIVALAMLALFAQASITEARSLEQRLDAHVSSLGKRVEMRLAGYTGTSEVRRGRRGKPPRPSAGPQIGLSRGDRIGFTTIPRAESVKVTLLDVRPRRVRTVERLEMEPAGESGRRWRTAFGRVRGADLMTFDATFAKDRRPRYRGGRVDIATYFARVSQR